MPRSFLITKLYKCKDSSSMDSDVSIGHIITSNDQMLRVENSSTDCHDVTTKSTEEDKCLEKFVGREVDSASPTEAATSPNEEMTSPRNAPAASPPTNPDKMAATLTSRIQTFSPRPFQDMRTTSNAKSFPFSMTSLPPTEIAAGLRRAVINSMPLPLPDREVLNAAALSVVNQQSMISRFNCFPWQPPLCCLLEPEVARLCRERVHFPVLGGALRLDPLQPPTPVTLRRPVNWLLSDDVRATSSAPQQKRKWNSTENWCRPSAAVSERSVNRCVRGALVTSWSTVRVDLSAPEPDRKWNSTEDRCRSSTVATERSVKRDSDEAIEVTACGPQATPGSSVAASGSGVVVGERKLTCRHCAKPYASLGALKMHIRTHTLPCRCQLCGKAFSRPWLLQGHLRTHTGERPFACPQCGRAFADRSNLRAHLQTHAELKKYACDRCTKTFSRLSLLVKHRTGPGVCGTLAASSSPWRP